MTSRPVQQAHPPICNQKRLKRTKNDAKTARKKGAFFAFYKSLFFKYLKKQKI